MKILLVQPGHYNFQTGRLYKSRHKKGLCPSFILPYLASFFPREADITLIDETLQDIDFDVPYDLVGISVKTPQAQRAYEVAAEFRKRGVFVLLGGYHVNLCPDEAAGFADAVICGEIETSWDAFWNDFASGCVKQRYLSPERFSMQQMPFPRFDLLNLKLYSAFYGTKIPLETSRGCVNHCAYCCTPEVYRGGIRYRPIKEVVEDIKRFLKDYPGIRQPLFVFVDDNLTTSKDRAMRLFESLRPLRIHWSGYFSYQSCQDEELVASASRSGCYSVFVGLESINDESLNSVNKGFNTAQDFSAVLRRLEKHRIILVLGMILGFLEDDEQTFVQTKRFLTEHSVPMIVLNPLYPFPGTPVYRTLKRRRLLTDEKFWLKKHNPYALIRNENFSGSRSLQTAIEELLAQMMTLRSILHRTKRSGPYRWPLLVHNVGIKMLLKQKGIFAFT